MTTTKVNELLRSDFIEALIGFSGGKISEQEANMIADRRLRYSDFAAGSPLGHKGPRWLAKRIVRNMNLIDD